VLLWLPQVGTVPDPLGPFLGTVQGRQIGTEELPFILPSRQAQARETVDFPGALMPCLPQVHREGQWGGVPVAAVAGAACALLRASRPRPSWHSR